MEWTGNTAKTLKAFVTCKIKSLYLSCNKLNKPYTYLSHQLRVASNYQNDRNSEGVRCRNMPEGSAEGKLTPYQSRVKIKALTPEATVWEICCFSLVPTGMLQQ